MSDARDIAYTMTRRVNGGGGYLGLLLRYGLEGRDMDPRDRSLVTELAYGVQRHRNKLDFIIAAFSRRPLGELDPEVLDVLRLGVYQLAQMRVPGHAAVNETVALAKRHLGSRPASYVNAVLRSASAGLEGLEWPSRDDLPLFLETIYSHPRWLVDYLLRSLGPEAAEEVCIADNTIQTLTLRVNTARLDGPALIGEIEARGGSAVPSANVDEALVGVSLPRAGLLELLEKGCCVVQDESSMLVSRIVDPGEKDTVIDACAAPGGKTTHLAQLGGDGCRVIAVDRNRSRLDALSKACERLGLENVDIVAGDSTRLAEYVEAGADAVLVDAPCSGLGTLRRNPELKWRRLPQDLAQLSEVQLALLHGAADVTRRGGKLVYSVCTYAREETVDVVGAFLASRPDYRLEDPAPHMPQALSDAVAEEGYVQLMPHLHDMEGMFIAALRRE